MTGRTDKGARGTPRIRRDDGSGSWDNLPPANPPPTGEEFDALTDLFLGEVGAAPGAAATHVDADSPAPARNGRAQPVLRLAGVEDDLETEDAATEQREHVPTKTRVVAAEEPAARRAERRAVAAGVTVECIVLGHLPVMASVWGAQYVREVSQSVGGPVAYLRIQRGYASIELIGDDGSTADLPSAKSLEEGMRRVAARTGRWVVRADAGDEATLAASPLVRVVTLLTGVDEMAIVAAYASIKSLAASLDAQSAELGSEPAIIHVAAMGAAKEKGLAVAKRLGGSIGRFIGREVVTDACGERISSSRPSEVVFTGRTDMLPGAAMELLAKVAAETEIVARPERREVSMARSGPALVRAEEVESAAEPEPVDLDELEVAVDERELAAAVADVVEEPAVVVPARVSAPVRGERAVPVEAEKPVARAEVVTMSSVPAAPAAQAARAAEPVVGADIDGERAEVLADAPSALALLLPGLRPVSVRCPYAEGIEFAVDRAGTVHLLSRIEDGAAEERALSELLVAGAWADAHASMLAASLGQSAGMAASGMAERAELHLFTDRPKASRRLLETSVNVHLLARVEVAGKSGWYCTDLN